MSDEPAVSNDRQGPARGKWVLAGFVAVAAYFLWTEHQAHVVQYLPLALLLACPLMHLFHHGHGGHGGREGSDEGRSKSSSIEHKHHSGVEGNR